MRAQSIYPGFFLFLSLPYWVYTPNTWADASLAFTLFFASIGWHELGHYLSWRYAGVSLKLYCTLIGPHLVPIDRPKVAVSILSALMGPLFSLSAALALYLFSSFNLYGINPQLIALTALLNLFWGGFQLLPISPLDGWLIIKGLCEVLWGASGITLAYGLSLIICLTLSALSSWLSPVISWIPAASAIFLSFQTLTSFRRCLKLNAADLDPVIRKTLDQAKQFKITYQVAQAKDLLTNLTNKQLKGRVIDQACFELADLLSSQGQFTKAYEILSKCEKRLSDESLLLFHRLCYQTERFDKAYAYSARAFQKNPDASTAIINAISCAKLFESQPRDQLLKSTIGWLQAAKRLHFKNWSILDTADFQVISKTQAFNYALDKLRSF